MSTRSLRVCATELPRATAAEQKTCAGCREQGKRCRLRHRRHAAERGGGCAPGRADRASLGEERAVDQEVVVGVDHAVVVKVAVDPAGLIAEEAGVDLEVVVAGDGSVKIR